jgi:hypothetical protein
MSTEDTDEALEITLEQYATLRDLGVEDDRLLGMSQADAEALIEQIRSVRAEPPAPSG